VKIALIVQNYFIYMMQAAEGQILSAAVIDFQINNFTALGTGTKQLPQVGA
jgi:hypothetical protein